MIVNETVVNFEIYELGNRLLGMASIDLPEINFNTSEVSGAGVNGTLDVPVTGSTESLELTLKWRTLYKDPVRYMRHNVINLSARAALQNYDSGKGKVKISPLKIDFRGRLKGVTPGSLKPAEQMESETKIECDYLKITVDGKVTCEIDKYNYRYEVNGVDFMSDVRRALGNKTVYKNLNKVA